MSHVRQQLREKALEFLTGLDTTGSRVYITRLFPFGDIELPALTIMDGPEESENLNMQGDLQRTYTMRITGFASLTSDIDRELDQMAVEVEKAMTPTLGDLAKLSVLTASDKETSGEGEAEIGSIQMEYTILYITSGDDPETAK